MSGDAPDGRRFAPTLTARLVEEEDGALALLAPSPGFFRARYEEGATVSAGAVIGELEVVGVLHRVVAPPKTRGRVVAAEPAGERPVDARTPLLRLDPKAVSDAAAAAGAAAEEDAGLAFKTPLGGRYYARPSPDAEPFVKVGDVLTGGETVALVEVMKTFNRVQYDPDGLPPRAKVVRIGPSDGDDIETGDVLLELDAE